MATRGLRTAVDGNLTRRALIARGAAAGMTVFVFGSTGCGGDEGGDGGAGGGGGSKGTIAFGQPDRGAAVYAPLIAGVREAASKRGYEIVESFSGGDVSKQINEINTWIAQGLEAIVVLPQDQEAITPLVDKAQESDTVFVAYSSELPGANGVVNFDHRQGADEIGTAVGEWINDNYGGEAEVALLTFDEVQTGRLRVRGAEKKMKEVAPGARVVADQKAILAPDALRVSRAMLQANPDIAAFICIADDGCLGVRQAFLDTGRDPESVYVTGFDGAKPVLERILAGNDPIKSTAALDLKEIGRMSVNVPANILEGKTPTDYNAPYLVVNQQDEAEIRRLIENYGA